jgi:pimeloyl-ACP methyl ester carboxylesterase
MKIWILLLSLLLGSTAYAAAVPDFYGELQQVKVNNANIAYYRLGVGKELVMITGHGDTMTMWPPAFLKKISEHRTVIIFDYPGIGKSVIQGDYPSSMEQLSNLVQAFIKTQKLTKPDLLGFSMGGSLTLYMATKHSSDYDHVMVIGAKAGGKITVQPLPKYFNMLKDPNISPEVAIKTLLFPASANQAADAYLKAIMQLPQEKRNSAALAAQATAVTAENEGAGIWNQLFNIHNKILIINGMEDVLTPVQNAVMLATVIPGAWLVQVKGAGHGVLFQEPDFTANLAELFLSS